MWRKTCVSLALASVTKKNVGFIRSMTSLQASSIFSTALSRLSLSGWSSGVCFKISCKLKRNFRRPAACIIKIITAVSYETLKKLFSFSFKNFCKNIFKTVLWIHISYNISGVNLLTLFKAYLLSDFKVQFCIKLAHFRE